MSANPVKSFGPQTLDRIPKAFAAERGVLASIMFDNSLLQVATEKLRPDQFLSLSFGKIFSGMIALAKNAQAIDRFTLAEYLHIDLEDEHLDAIIDHRANLGNIQDYIRIVLCKHFSREGKKLAHEWIEQIDQEDVRSVIEPDSSIFDRIDNLRKDFAALQPQTGAQNRAVVWNSADFLRHKFPPREALAVISGSTTPIFTKQSINQIFAKRGTGKSLLALSLAGEFQRWRRNPELEDDGRRTP